MNRITPPMSRTIPIELLQRFSDPDLEQSFLGSLLVNPEYLVEYEGSYPFLSELFTSGKHSVVFQAMLDMVEAHKTIDFVSLSFELSSHEIGENVSWEVFLSFLAENAPLAMSWNMETYHRQLYELYMRRLGVAYANQILQISVNSKIDQLLDDVLELTNSFVSPFQDDMRARLIGEAMSEAHADAERIRETGLGMIGIPTGFIDLDDHLGGLPLQEMSVVLGDTGIGKTQFALEVAANAVIAGHRPLIFSMEMSDKSLALRLASHYSGVDSLKIRRGLTSDQEWAKYLQAKEYIESQSMLFYVDDTPGLSPRQMRSRMMAYTKKHDVDLVIIDWIQLMVPDVGEPDHDYTIITQSLRQLQIAARELNVHVLVVSNVSRNLSRKADKRPDIHDGLSSGAIERFADLIIGLYRHEYYYPEEIASRGLGEVIILKFRSGSVGVVQAGFVNGRWCDVSAVTTQVTEILF